MFGNVDKLPTELVGIISAKIEPHPKQTEFKILEAYWSLLACYSVFMTKREQEIGTRQNQVNR